MYRKESDSIGEIDVRADVYWGSNTQRSLNNFKIGDARMPIQIVRSIAIIKKAAARVNAKLGLLDKDKSTAIIAAADEVIAGTLDEHFPLLVWQTGSGTHTNMNVNEVIANRAIEKLLGEIGSKSVHPNDHVNMGQSSNDTFPTATHIAVVNDVNKFLLPSLLHVCDVLRTKVSEFSEIFKVGRTHFQDAAPITLGQEFSGYLNQVERNIGRIKNVVDYDLVRLAQGGTAVGTGLSAVVGFDEKIVSEISEITGYEFVIAENKFSALASDDPLVVFSGVLNTAAVSFMKIANDVRMLGSGPRCGIGELSLPANEPGSSIMPGKVNPTQCEVMTMVCAQVMGNHTAITVGGMSGQFELNTFRPLLAKNVLESIRLLSDAAVSFSDNCLVGLRANERRISEFLDSSLMNATALLPIIGYDKVAQIVKFAHNNGLKLKEAVISLGIMNDGDYDDAMCFHDMVRPRSK